MTHESQSIKREWFCNAEFDLTLTSPHGKTLPDKFLEAARQMAWHFWPALNSKDSLLVPSSPPAEYLEYLGNLDFDLPEFRTEPDRNRVFTPFGWSREAEDSNRLYRRPAAHPDRAIVAQVNSREFGAQLEADVFPESGNGFDPVFFRDAESLRRWIEKAKSGRYVGKGNHGFGGLAQIRFNPRDLNQISLESLEKMLYRQGGMAVEAEDKIATEFGILFRLGRDGAFSPPRIHRLLSDEKGGFSGSMLMEKDPQVEPWRIELVSAMEKIAHRLFQAGYFGPVGFDAYVRRELNGLRLRPFSDLNARCTMAYATHGLANTFTGKAVAVLQFSTKSIRLPHFSSELTSHLRGIHFTASTQIGVFVLTPLGMGLQRHSLALIANDEAGLGEMRSSIMEFITHA